MNWGVRWGCYIHRHIIHCSALSMWDTVHASYYVHSTPAYSFFRRFKAVFLVFQQSTNQMEHSFHLKWPKPNALLFTFKSTYVQTCRYICTYIPVYLHWRNVVENLLRKFSVDIKKEQERHVYGDGYVCLSELYMVCRCMCIRYALRFLPTARIMYVGRRVCIL
jgi:hypothetical protein